GFDVHQLVENRKLILCGVEIPHHLGLLGHSDADVSTHAIMDAILSSIGERDIGVHFPDNDDCYKGISSITLLQKVNEIVKSKNAKIQSISCVIMAQAPKLANYIPQMCANIAAVLNLPTNRVNISATTTERLGIIGEEKGIAAQAVCLAQL
ncbi:MAG: 2-C-methyl-D-erythritol 2,4-cyclodiphosphate synthase, partial [Clostridia bacterium]|nr:2-C-methyl-D-erythritol 2,4-cyclodiphosphate synthase [Clostridia bacterium]